MRGETEEQRWRRNFSDLLQELRVAQAGVQILFAFLLTIPFTSRFSQPSEFQKAVYLVALLSSAAAASMIIAPVAYHRALFQRRRKPQLVRSAHRLATGGLAMMVVAMVSSILLALGTFVPHTVAITVAVVTAGWFTLLWAVVPLWLRIGTVAESAGDPAEPGDWDQDSTQHGDGEHGGAVPPGAA